MQGQCILEHFLPFLEHLKTQNIALNGNLRAEIYLGHINLTEIRLAVELFWRVGIAPGKFVMGFGFYGRALTLAAPECLNRAMNPKEPRIRGNAQPLGLPRVLRDQ